jgi:mono/diheme cytochrome c family protein
MLWRVLAALLVLTAVAFGGFYAWARQDEIAAIDPAQAKHFDSALIATGAQLAALGNCAVCHTEAGGKPYAGGFPVQSPFGTIYGSNITPDPETGIGSWPESAFRRALRQGVARKGKHLYPAFPYDHFTQLNDADVSALYAFIMTRQPVRQENREPDLLPPLQIRLFAAAWKLLFLRAGPYQPDVAQGAEWNRGAYLGDGLGHCGSCHTPRNLLGAEKRGEAFAGGEGEGWHAPALDVNASAPAPWDADQFYSYLRTGFAQQHGAAAGPMRPVVRDLRKVPDADVKAIAVYIASFSRDRDAAQKDQDTKRALDFAQQRAVKETTGRAAAGDEGSSADDGSPGAAIFAGACAECHHTGGALPYSRPVELGLSAAVNAPGPIDLIRIVLEGIHPPPGESGFIMPGFDGALSDQQITNLIAYVRAHYSRRPAWSNIVSTLSNIRKGRTAALEASNP